MNDDDRTMTGERLLFLAAYSATFTVIFVWGLMAMYRAAATSSVAGAFLFWTVGLVILLPFAMRDR